MTSRTILAASIMTLLVAGCGKQSKDMALTSAQIERPVARPCPSPDPGRACLADTHALQENFDKALAGDYQAQRNTAYALSGASPYIIAQPDQACAWRIVIRATRPADAIFSDASQTEIECGRLSNTERDTADEVAVLIRAQIAA